MRKSVKTTFVVSLVGSLMIVVPGPIPSVTQTRSGSVRVVDAPPYAPDEIFVRFKEGVSPYQGLSAHAGIGAVVVERFRTVENLELVKLPPGMDVKEALEFYQQHPDVLYAEPNYVVEADKIPNDPRFNELWGLHNIGQLQGSLAGADIDAPEA